MNGQVESLNKSGSVPNAKVPTGIEKRCSKCGELKPLDFFHYREASKDKRCSRCKKCMCGYSAVWRKANPLKHYEAKKRWNKANPQRVSGSQKCSRNKHAEKIKLANKRYRELNFKEISRKNKLLRKKNLKRHNELNRQWNKANPEKVKIGNRKAYERRISTLKGKLSMVFSCSIWRSLRGNKKRRHWETLVGYTIEQLKKHLEKQFKQGMTWENYGKKGWEIDHIIPISVFNYEKPEDEDFKRCWSLKNLQPLWAIDNIKKYNKICEHFQPRIIFGGIKC